MNSAKVVDFILKNTTKLEPEKIRALSEVIRALGGEVKSEPNRLPPGQVTDENEVLENAPFPIEDITGVQVEGGKKRVIKIYKEK